MPAGLPAVPQADINVIRQWIGEGALPVSSASGPIRVTSLSPAPSSSELALPGSITVAFDREVNAPSVNAASFTLRRAGPDGLLGTADDVTITPTSVTVPSANPRSAVMDLTGVPFVIDRYGITLLGTGGAAILDLGGNALDGESDGVAGGDFAADVQCGTDARTGRGAREVCRVPHGQRGELPGSLSPRAQAQPHEPRRRRERRGARAAAGFAARRDRQLLDPQARGQPSIVGRRMPLIRPVVEQTTIDVIR